MKRFMIYVVLMFFSGGWAWAQSTMPGKGGTPVVNARLGAPAPRTAPRAPLPPSNMHGVNLQLRAQMRQIQKNLKAGKITKAQAQAARENLRNVRKQELEFLRQGNQKDITTDQKSQLQGLLDQNTDAH